MINTKAVYTLEIKLEDGTKVVKIGYAGDIVKRFEFNTTSPTTVLYVDKPMTAKSFVAAVKDDYKHAEVVKGFYPIQYSTLLELRIINFENELKNA